MTLLYYRLRIGSLQKLSQALVRKAELTRKEEELAHRKRLDEEARIQRGAQADAEKKLKERGENLEARFAWIESKLVDIGKKEAKLSQKEETLKEKEAALEELTGLSKAKAKKQLLARVEKEIRSELNRHGATIQEEIESQREREAAKIIATSLQRLAVPTVSNISVTTVALPNEEMKRRIVGREGRNIRTLEQLTGVNILLDETPQTVLISGFDPLRKHIAKQALTALIQDGRIHPSRLEEAVARATQAIDKEARQLGTAMAEKAGVFGLHNNLVSLLGKLHFRTSYGQNVLEHSYEVSALMGMMAAELHLDESLARRIGLLHDMGKAASEEKEGTHALIGRDLALRYGESEAVANGIGCHHDEIPPLTVEGSLCSVADTLSGARPGARQEPAHHAFKRLTRLEELSREIPGVERAYALHAGREVRIIAHPEQIDDAAALALARSLAKKIETELSYPGRIKVTVIRETRATEYAS